MLIGKKMSYPGPLAVCVLAGGEVWVQAVTSM